MKDQIIMVLILIEVYKNVQAHFEKMFSISRHTIQQVPPDMAATFTRLAVYMQKEMTNEFILGHTAKYNVSDLLSKGMNITVMKVEKGNLLSATDVEENEGFYELSDDVDLLLVLL